MKLDHYIFCLSLLIFIKWHWQSKQLGGHVGLHRAVKWCKKYSNHCKIISVKLNKFLFWEEHAAVYYRNGSNERYLSLFALYKRYKKLFFWTKLLGVILEAEFCHNWVNISLITCQLFFFFYLFGSGCHRVYTCTYRLHSALVFKVLLVLLVHVVLIPVKYQIHKKQGREARMLNKTDMTLKK